MNKKIMILVVTLIFFVSTSSIYVHGKTTKSYMKIHNKIYCLQDEDVLERDNEKYYKLDFVIDKLGHVFEISGEEVTVKVRNIDIKLNKNSKNIVIKTPPYGTRLNDDGVLTKTDFSHKDDLYVNQPDRRKEFLELYKQSENFEEYRSNLRNILLEDVNIIKLEKFPLIKNNDNFYISLEFLDEIFETNIQGNFVSIIDYYVDYLIVPIRYSDNINKTELQLPENDDIPILYRNGLSIPNEEDLDLTKEYRDIECENNDVKWFPLNIYIIGYTKNGYIITEGFNDSYLIDNSDIENIKYYIYNNRDIGALCD